jgi:hypothetical protein
MARRIFFRFPQLGSRKPRRATMADKTANEADKNINEKDGHRRFTESVDVTRTPEEELKDARRRSGSEGRPGAIIK